MGIQSFIVLLILMDPVSSLITLNFRCNVVQIGSE